VSNKPFDLAIVGGGIIGAMLAWRSLKRHPEWRTLWVDRSLLGHGASIYSGGLITPFGRTEPHRKFANISARLLVELTEDIGSLPVRELTGWLVAPPDKRTELLTWFVSGHLPSAVSSNILHSLIPDLALPNGEIFMGPFPVRHGWPIDMIKRITSLCRANGSFSIWEGVELTDWRPSGNSISLSFLVGDAVETQHLVLASGPWQIRNELDQPPGIRVKKVAALHVEIPPVDSAPVILFANHDAFLLPLPEERRWLFSFPSAVWDVEPDHSKLAIDFQDDEIAAGILARYAPAMAAQLRGGRVFCDGYTENRVPLICPMGDHSKVIYAGGCSGSGFRFAPGIAEQALDMLEA
jgi:glycine/D-amino acid oxidase-like deaminating enzyme